MIISLRKLHLSFPASLHAYKIGSIEWKFSACEKEDKQAADMMQCFVIRHNIFLSHPFDNKKQQQVDKRLSGLRAHKS